MYKKDAVLKQPNRRGQVNLSTDPHASPPHCCFGETSGQMVSCFSSQKLKRRSWSEELEQPQPAFEDERG